MGTWLGPGVSERAERLSPVSFAGSGWAAKQAWGCRGGQRRRREGSKEPRTGRAMAAWLPGCLVDWLTKAAAGWKFRRLRRTGGGLEGRDKGERLVVGVAIGISGAKRRGAACGWKEGYRVWCLTLDTCCPSV